MERKGTFPLRSRLFKPFSGRHRAPRTPAIASDAPGPWIRVADLTATFSPDGQQIVFRRPVPGQGNQLFMMRPTLNEDGTLPTATQLTLPPGVDLIPNWGELRVTGAKPAP